MLLYVHFHVLLREMALMAMDVRALTLHGCGHAKQDKDEGRWEVRS